MKSSSILIIIGAAAGGYLILQTTGQLTKIQQLLENKGSSGGTQILPMPDLSFIGDIFKNLPAFPTVVSSFDTSSLKNTLDSLMPSGIDLSKLIPTMPDLNKLMTDAVDTATASFKKTIEDMMKAAGDAAGKIIASQSTPLIPVDIVKTASAAGMGTGIIYGILTLDPVLFMGGLFSEGIFFSKLRQDTITSTGKAPETIVGDWFSNLWHGLTTFKKGGSIFNSYTDQPLMNIPLLSNQISAPSIIGNVTSSINQTVKKISSGSSGYSGSNLTNVPVITKNNSGINASMVQNMLNAIKNPALAF